MGWVIPNKQVTACGPRQQMMSPKFELGGIPEMCMRFWPRGDCDLDPSEKEEVCSFRIICPKRGTYRLTLSAGYQQRYLEHFPDRKTWSRSRVAFILYAEVGARAPGG